MLARLRRTTCLTQARARHYAPRVKFYGSDLAKSSVLDIKKRALAASPAFRQSIIGAIDVASAS